MGKFYNFFEKFRKFCKKIPYSTSEEAIRDWSGGVPSPEINKFFAFHSRPLSDASIQV
jgi:hypothetical protein